MKRKLLSTIIILVTAAGTSVAQSESAQQGKVALSVIFDTSWSCEEEMSDFITLARQTIVDLNKDDCIEVSTAHSGQPRIRVAQILRSGTPEEVKNITSNLNEIHSEFLSKARITDALQIAIKRIDDLCAKDPNYFPIILVFTDGELEDSETERLLHLLPTITQRGWPLYITGNRHSNRQLLVAANQGQFKFALLNEASPALWIATIRNSHAAQQVQSLKPLTLPSIEEKSPDDSSQHGRKLSLDVSATLSEAPAGSPQKPVTVAQDNNVPTIYSPAVPSFTATKSDANLSEAPSRRKSYQKEAQPITATRREFWGRYWWLLTPIILLIPIGFILSRGASAARKWTAQKDSLLKPIQQKDVGILIATLNGQTHNLGRLDQFMSIRVGSAPENTIRAIDKNVGPHHLLIYRKGQNLLIRNTGTTPISANGSQVKPGAKLRILVPSVIQISENTKLNLTLLRPKPVLEDRSVKNEISSVQQDNS